MNISFLSFFSLFKSDKHLCLALLALSTSVDTAMSLVEI